MAQMPPQPPTYPTPMPTNTPTIPATIPSMPYNSSVSGSQTTLSSPTLSPPKTNTRRVMLVLGSVLLLIIGYTVTPGVTAQALKQAYPTVHAHINAPTGTVNTHQSVTFSADGSSGRDLTYTWRFSDGRTATGPTVTRTFDSPAHKLTVILSVADPLAGQQSVEHSDSTNLEFSVYPAAPAARFSATPESSYFGYYVRFDASSSSSESQITRYSWNFGDPGNGFNTEDSSYYSSTSHYYSQPGTYTVTLTVTDDFNQTATQTQTVTV